MAGFAAYHHHKTSAAPLRHPHRIHKVVHKRRSTVIWHRTLLTVTAYVVNAAEIGKCDVYANSRTATGTVPMVGTAAVDPSVFPFGTKFIIPGYGYAIARDTGGLIVGHIVDVVQPTCNKAIKWGRQRLVAFYSLPRNSGKRV